MNILSDFANFGELHIFFGGGGAPGRGAPKGSLRPGRQKPSLRLCKKVSHDGGLTQFTGKIIVDQENLEETIISLILPQTKLTNYASTTALALEIVLIKSAYQWLFSDNFFAP